MKICGVGECVWQGSGAREQQTEAVTGTERGQDTQNNQHHI